MPQFALTRDEVLSIVAPYHAQLVPSGDSEGRRLRRQVFKNQLHMIASGLAKRLRGGERNKAVDRVADYYDTVYRHDAPILPGFQSGGRALPFGFGDDLLVMQGFPMHRCIIAQVEKTIRMLSPGSVCEIGSGMGRNLIYLASRFPQIRFAGFDLSHHAVANCHALQRLETLDLQFPEVPGALTPEQMEAVRAIDFFQANAADLSARPDDSYDLMYTVSAMEQMHVVLPQVLKEVHRVGRRHVVFCEPFLEVNDIWQRLYLWSRNYFRVDIRFVESFGFRTLEHCTTIPRKQSFTYSALIAEIVA